MGWFEIFLESTQGFHFIFVVVIKREILLYEELFVKRNVSSERNITAKIDLEICMINNYAFSLIILTPMMIL